VDEGSEEVQLEIRSGSKDGGLRGDGDVEGGAGLVLVHPSPLRRMLCLTWGIYSLRPF
jgi:hypothetical protein